MADSTTNVIDLIKSQHQQVKALLAQVARGTGAAGGMGATGTGTTGTGIAGGTGTAGAGMAGAATGSLDGDFCELRRMIVVHETAEEEVIYPALRASGAEGQRVAEARTTEEQKGAEVLSRLENMELGGTEFTALFEQFRMEVLAHAEAEEETVLPLLASTQSQDNLRKMSGAFELAETAAPTHAHPHTGTSAVSNMVTGPAVAIMDRVRDALRKS
ncbi:MAG TPA: hemerythrin domain-containing protein [Acidimicrobiales bacterium]|nr:hemerythrin domain-containing protein [Acidimicrobiales bacterium]